MLCAVDIAANLPGYEDITKSNSWAESDDQVLVEGVAGQLMMSVNATANNSGLLTVAKRRAQAVSGR